MNDWQQALTEATDAANRAHAAAHAYKGKSENTRRAHSAIHEALKALERAGRWLGFENEAPTGEEDENE